MGLNLFHRVFHGFSVNFGNSGSVPEVVMVARVVCDVTWISGPHGNIVGRDPGGRADQSQSSD